MKFAEMTGAKRAKQVLKGDDGLAGKRKEIHGNMAKVDPKAEIEPLYVANTTAVSRKKEREKPVADDDNAGYARDFANGNKK